MSEWMFWALLLPVPFWTPFALTKLLLALVGAPYLWFALQKGWPLWIWGDKRNHDRVPKWWFDREKNRGEEDWKVRWRWFATRNVMQNMKFKLGRAPKQWVSGGLKRLEYAELAASGKNWGFEVRWLGPLVYLRAMRLSETYWEYGIGWKMSTDPDGLTTASLEFREADNVRG